MSSPTGETRGIMIRSMRRTFALSLLFVTAILVPTSMLTIAFYYDRRTARTSGCYGDWTEGQRALYDWLVGASPFVAAALAFAAIAVTGIRWRYLVATVVGIGSFAVFGISALVVVYYECA
jgi:hypothetical protein